MNKLKNYTCILVCVYSLMIGMSSIYSTEKTWSLQIAVDPAAYFFKGISGIVFLNHIRWPQLTAGFEYFSMDMPSFYVEQHANNKGQGWNQDIRHGYIFYGDYFFDRSSNQQQGFHLGTGISFLQSDITRNQFNDKNSIKIMELFLRGGYRWFPLLNKPVFIDPWVSLLFLTINEDTTIGSQSYYISPVSLLASIHAGIQF